MTIGRTQIIEMLLSHGERMQALLDDARALRDRTIGDGVYLRGLIEYSNVCYKDCFYCGIRRSSDCKRYVLSDEEVLKAARLAWESGYGSVVIQAGENTSPVYVAAIEKLVRSIYDMSGGQIGITLSLGEQSHDTYRRWYEAGARRYLLRIETSDPRLYRIIHPDDHLHCYRKRLRSVESLRSAGYQVGTGVLIGFPGQTVADLADDLLFMEGMDIDMCGMGPYIPAPGTPMAASEGILPDSERVGLTLKMIAVLRHLMPDINIAAATALEVLDPGAGRLKAISAGANVVMPNLTPALHRENYTLYEGKTRVRTELPGINVQYGMRGDSPRFSRRK